MNNRPRGRDKNVTGTGKGIGRRGSGLNTGPVGRQDGYQGRRPSVSFAQSSSGGQTRALGGKSILVIVVLAALLIFGGGGSFLGNLFGGSSGSSTSTVGNVLSSLGSLGSIGDLLGGFAGGGSVSEGWTGTANTGKLNSSVASSARAKRTEILGGGKDVVTIMVYMCGTDLESKNGMATSDLLEMTGADLGENVNLLVYTGGCKQWKNKVVSNSVNQIYKVEDRDLKCLVSNDGTASMTNPNTLSKFIQYCAKSYPANRYDLILWDHGGGSISGYGYDEKNKSSGSMSLKGINQALSKGGVTFDFIGFDACLMATLENALMLDNYADYLIASEETEPGIGWYYTDWLNALSKNTSMPTIEIGQKIVDDFVSKCNQKCAGQKTTLSVIDLAELSATVPEKLSEFAASTSELLQNNQYKTVSDARSNTREFAASNRIDQVDLVHLAYNIGTNESKELAKSLLGAVKYNKTSSSISNAYGISIYFPYKSTSKVDSAVAAYEAIGMDDEYSRCIQQFASLEVTGQAVAGGNSSPLSTLLGSGSSSSPLSSGGVTDLLGGLFGSSGSSLLESLTGGNLNFLSGKDLLAKSSAQSLTDNQFDSTKLVWTKSDGVTVMKLSEAQWSLVHDLQLNVFYDDGEGYIDLGLDNVYDFTEKGELIGDYDGTWLAIDRQPVAYYYVDSLYEGDNFTITGRVPVLINGERAELILVFDTDNPYGYIAGARYDYVNGETDTVAKGVVELTKGDKLEFIADYYTYDGEYENSYIIAEPMTYTGDHEISNVYLDDPSVAVATYLFTDIYAREYWTPELN